MDNENGFLCHPAFDHLVKNIIYAYMLKILKKDDMLSIFTETFLYAIYHFTKTRNPVSTLVLLVLEIYCCLLTPYLFMWALLELCEGHRYEFLLQKRIRVYIGVLECVCVSILIAVWELRGNPDQLRHRVMHKFSFFYVFNNLALISERWCCFIMVLFIVYHYIRHHRPKNRHDISLLLYIVHISILLCILEKDSVSLSIRAIFCSFVMIWHWITSKTNITWRHIGYELLRSLRV